MPNTTTATLTQELMDLISSELLIQVDDEYLFYKNGPIMRADEDARVPGTNIVNFNRPTLPGGTYTETSRRLTDGTAVNTTGLAIAMTQVGLTTREYGGPHDGTNVTPFSVTEFLKNRARHNIVGIVGEFLRRDRNRFLDVAVRDLMAASTSVAVPTATEGTITAGQLMTVAFLRILNKVMKDAKIPTFPNGHWRLILNTRDEQNLKADPEYREAYRYWLAANPSLTGKAMMFEGFEIMVSTNIPTKGVGSGGAVTGYQSFAFGPYGIGHAVTMEPEVRRADDTDFGRLERVIWKSEEAVGTLYSDLLFRTITT